MSSKIMDQLSFALKKTLGIIDEKRQHRIHHRNVLWDLSSTQDLENSQKLQLSDPSQGSQHSQSHIESETVDNSEGSEIRRLREIFMEHKQKCHELKNFQHSKMAYQSQIEQLTQQVFEQEAVVKENKRLNDFIKRTMLENNKLNEQILAIASKNWKTSITLNQTEIFFSSGEIIDKVTLQKKKLQIENRLLKEILGKIKTKLSAAHKAHSIDMKSIEEFNGKIHEKSFTEEAYLKEQVNKLEEQNRELRKHFYLQEEETCKEDEVEKIDYQNSFFLIEIERLNNALRKEAQIREKCQFQNIQLNKRIPLILEELETLAIKVKSLSVLEKQYANKEQRIEELSQENSNLKKEIQELDLQNEEIFERLKSLDKKSVERRNKYEQNLQQIIKNYEKQLQRVISVVGEGQYSREIDLLRDEVERLGGFLEQRNESIEKLISRLKEKDEKLEEMEIEKDRICEQLKNVFNEIEPNKEVKIEELMQILKNKSDDAQNQKNDFKNSEINQKEEILKLQAQKKLLQDQIQQMKLYKAIDLQQLKQNNVKLHQIIKQESNNYELLKNQHIKLQEEYETSISKKRQLQNVISELQVEFERLRDCIVRLKEERKIILANNKQLRSSLESMCRSFKSHPPPILTKNN